MMTTTSRFSPTLTAGSRITTTAFTVVTALMMTAGVANASSRAETRRAEIGSESAVLGAVAQPEAGLPAAETIFEKFIDAIGGREKLEKITSRRITGTYEGDPFDFKANVTVWWENDGRFHQRVAEPAGLKYDLHVTEGMTWSVVMSNDPTPIGGVQRQELLDTADFYGEANYKERYKEIKTVREAKAGDTPIYIVSATTHAGRPHTLFFAKDTGLLIGNRVPVTGPNNSLRDMTVRIKNYKDFGGVLYPTLFIQEFGGGIKPNRYEFIEIEVNVEDGHDYSVPDSIRQIFEAASNPDLPGG